MYELDLMTNKVMIMLPISIPMLDASLYDFIT